MNYIKITKCDIANGPGIRVVLWCSGCSIGCKGCHNPESWNFNAGQAFDDEAMTELLEALSPSYVQGLTLSGGHPLDPNNAERVLEIVKKVRETYPDKTIWLYTGYDLSIDNFIAPTTDTHITVVRDILNMCDVAVDGRYIEELRNIALKFRGSSNQRLIDVHKTIEAGKIVTIE